MPNYDQPGVEAQVEKIRSEIQLSGKSRVGCDELCVLCPNASEAEKLNGIAQIAEWERWTFQYLPDGSVIFSSLP